MFDITDLDMAYVLSTFVAVPARWIERFGWRAMSVNEQAITYHYFAELGQRMNIKTTSRSWASG